MTVDELVEHILERVSEVEDWAAEGFLGEIDGFTIRNYRCVATPLRIQRDSSRKEHFGVVFRLAWEGRSGKSFVDVDVRLNPQGSMSQKGDGRTHDPYFAVYLADSAGTAGLITHNEFRRDLSKSITRIEFFRRILAYACRESTCAKVFGAKQSLSD